MASTMALGNCARGVGEDRLSKTEVSVLPEFIISRAVAESQFRDNQGVAENCSYHVQIARKKEARVRRRRHREVKKKRKARKHGGEERGHNLLCRRRTVREEDPDGGWHSRDKIQGLKNGSGKEGAVAG